MFSLMGFFSSSFIAMRPSFRILASTFSFNGANQPATAHPKGKSSAFIFFGSATRAEIKAAHPDWSLGDVGRELGKRWKELSDDDKKPFHDQAAKDAERYKTEMEAYKAKQATEEE